MPPARTPADPPVVAPPSGRTGPVGDGNAGRIGRCSLDSGPNGTRRPPPAGGIGAPATIHIASIRWWGGERAMSGLVESASAIMRMAERRLDVVAHNVANLATPGYKRRVGFAQALRDGASVDAPAIATHLQQDQGRITETGNPFDLAISGDGYFRLRAGETTLFTRQGQFRRDADGRLMTPQGYALQQAGGGDVILDAATMRLERDGTMMANGRALARLAIERPVDPAALRIVGETFVAGEMQEASDAIVRQGAIEASNVSLGDEMTGSMAAVREAENGAKLIQLYDELMGRVVTTFAGGGR
ncbi:hypothetical protein ASG37_07985 [Sphingomonas sp. Leaf407]|nr:hypothetical protein ASG37_07985 [Sphingomonas sp. Leaf407]